MDIGDVRLYKGKPVLIISGAYEIGGRISNFWDFIYISKNGNLGKCGGDYDNGVFSPKNIKHTKKIKILLLTALLKEGYG